MTQNQGHAGGPEEPSLAPVEGLLDELGRRDRALAPASLEDRLFVATRGVLRAHAGGEAGVVVRAVTPRWMSGALRVAAVVGLVVSAGVVWRAINSAPTPTPPVGTDVAQLSEAELDELASMLAMRDDGVADEVHSITSEAERVAGSLGELFGESLES